MSLDIRYRPRTYDDVLGQDATIAILREYVTQGRGFQQSYLFCGGHGSGKTSLARILARALLCESPVEGNPCGGCGSCKSLLEHGTSTDYVEVDAATNSGKADVKKIIDELAYATFSGKRRIYLFDECFTEDTVVSTPNGHLTIKELVDQRLETQVWAGAASGKGRWADVSDWFDHGEREVLELELEGGLILRVTESQLLFTTNRGWVEAKSLTCEDDVIVVSLAP